MSFDRLGPAMSLYPLVNPVETSYSTCNLRNDPMVLRVRSKFLPEKNIYKFQSVSVSRPEDSASGRGRDGGRAYACLRRTERPPHARFSCTVPSSIVSPSAAELANP